MKLRRTKELCHFGATRYFVIFVVHLFRKLCTKFHQSRLSFIDILQKNILVSFSGHNVQRLQDKKNAVE